MNTENREIITVDSDPHTIGTPAPDTSPVWSVDLSITLWLDANFKRSQSARTRGAYAETLATFRSALHSQGLDLDSVASQDEKRATQIARDRVKQIAQLLS